MSKTKYIRVCSLFLSLSLLQGCGSLISLSSVLEKIEYRPKDHNVVIVSGTNQENLATYAEQFALMAILSKTVYRKDISPDIRSQKSCEYLKTGQDDPFGLPRDVHGNGWYRWSNAKESSPCHDDHGLAYETYIRRTSNGQVHEAVIAFRGTENDSKPELFMDWSTNVSASFGIEPDEYRRAQKLTLDIVNELRKEFGDIEIYSAGHSLGGGLAQQAVYLLPDIKAAFTFDPTPVTNWTQLVQKNIIKKDYPTIHRIYHWHEGLAYVRAITSRFNGRRLGRTDYEFYFQDGNPVAAHEMGILSCNLAKQTIGRKPEHFLPPEFVDGMLNNKNMCPDVVKL